MSWWKIFAGPIVNSILGVPDAGTAEEDRWAAQQAREAQEREHDRILQEHRDHEQHHGSIFDPPSHDAGGFGGSE